MNSQRQRFLSALFNSTFGVGATVAVRVTSRVVIEIAVVGVDGVGVRLAVAVVCFIAWRQCC